MLRKNTEVFLNTQLVGMLSLLKLIAASASTSHLERNVLRAIPCRWLYDL